MDKYLCSYSMHPHQLLVLTSRIRRLPEPIRDRYDHDIYLLQQDLSRHLGDNFGTRIDRLSQFQTSIVQQFKKSCHASENTVMLMKCIEYGDGITLQRIISNGSTQNSTYPHLLLLMYASFLGRIDIIQLLLHSGCNVNTPSNFTHHEQFSALCFATMNNQIHAMRLLLSSGANLNHTSSGGITPLLIACRCGHTLAIFEILSHPNVDVTYTDDTGCGVLNHSVQMIHNMKGGIQSMLLLLLYGAPLNPRIADSTGRTPLHTACFGYQYDASVLLVSFGADTKMLSGDGFNIIDLLLCRDDRIDHSACRMLTHLLDVKPDLDMSSRNASGYTPAILALDMLSVGTGEETFKFLCEHGADLSIGDRDEHRTVLHEVAELGLPEMVEKVLTSLSKIFVYSDLKDVNGYTPESIARNQEARCAAQTGGGNLETRARYLRIAERIHEFSRDVVIKNWRKQTQGGLHNWSHKRAHVGKSVTHNESPRAASMGRAQPGSHISVPYTGNINHNNL